MILELQKTRVLALIAFVGLLVLPDSVVAQRGMAQKGPSARPAQRPSPNFGSRPSPNFGSRPSFNKPNYGTRPTPNWNTRPSPNYGTRPSYNRPNYNTRPAPNWNTRPSPNYGTRPSYNKPTNNSSTRPNYGTRPTRPAPSYGTRPSYNKPNNSLPTQPSFGTRPSPNSGNRPTNPDGFQDFLRPPTRPNDKFLGGSKLPATRPNESPQDFVQRPGRPNPVRPGEPGFRPGDNTKPTTGYRPGAPSKPPYPGFRPGDHIKPTPSWAAPSPRPPWWRPPGQRPPSWRPPNYRPPLIIYLPTYGNGFWNGTRWQWGWNNYRVNWWSWSTPTVIDRWIGVVGTTPIYYDYGVNLTYNEGNVYLNNELVGNQEQFSEQAVAIASSVPKAAKRRKTEWLPLGVFALTAKDAVARDATLFLQLAITKDKIIAGTLRNTATGKTIEVEGTVDKQSQRAAVKPVDDDWPVVETGIYNLTENETGILIHFSKDEVQNWKATRLDAPDSK